MIIYIIIYKFIFKFIFNNIKLYNYICIVSPLGTSLVYGVPNAVQQRYALGVMVQNGNK